MMRDGRITSSSQDLSRTSNNNSVNNNYHIGDGPTNRTSLRGSKQPGISNSNFKGSSICSSSEPDLQNYGNNSKMMLDNNGGGVAPNSHHFRMTNNDIGCDDEVFHGSLSPINVSVTMRNIRKKTER